MFGMGFPTYWFLTWCVTGQKIAKNVIQLNQFSEMYLVKGQWLYHISIQIGSFVRTNISWHDRWVFLLCKYCDHIYRSMRLIWESMWTNVRKCNNFPGLLCRSVLQDSSNGQLEKWHFVKHLCITPQLLVVLCPSLNVPWHKIFFT